MCKIPPSLLAVLALHLVAICAVLQKESPSSGPCDTLYLLHVVPYPDGYESENGWDKGLEVIPAGHIATQHINDRQDILRGQRLEMINIPSEACERPTPFNGYVEIFRNVSSSQQKCVFGVIGLYCSSVTSITSPLFSHPRFGYIQLTSATSPLLRNTNDFPYLFSAVASNEVYNSVVVEIMADFNWTKISVIYDPQLILYRSTAMSFSELIETTPNVRLLAGIHVMENYRTALLFERFVMKESRVNYLSVNVKESGKIMCGAFRHNFLWPEYVYIFPDRDVSEILSYNKNVSKSLAYNDNCIWDEMILAVEGIFTLQFRLAVSNDTILAAGTSYLSYHKEYQEALSRTANMTGMQLEDNNYANTLYDQVWAFALAMNNSIDKIDTSINASFEDIVYMTPDIRNVLAEELRQVSFQGATGTVRFDERQEVQTFVDIFQVKNGTQVRIGVFNSYTKNITFLDNFDKQTVPPDSFKTVRYAIPLWLGIPVLILQGLLLTMLLTSAIALTYWKKKPEVKSTSLYISFVILIGCLLMCISPIIYTITYVFDTPLSVFTFLCNVELWFSWNGISIIVVTLFFRLLRIVQVFRSYHSTGKYWSDLYLLLYICLMSCGTIMVLLVWTVVDPLHIVPKLLYQSTARPPFYLEYKYCSSAKLGVGVWLALSYSWIGLLLILVMFLAIRTRHIKRKHFKDTKKVNVFIFCICIIFALFIPLSHLLEDVNIVLASYILRWLSYFTIVLMCQLLLFLPKYVPLLYANFRTKSSYRVTPALDHVFKQY